MTVWTPNEVDEEILKMAEFNIKRLGTPILVGFIHENELYLLEGSHRIEACKRNSITPKIQLVQKEHEYVIGYDNNYMCPANVACKYVLDDLGISTAMESITNFGKCKHEIDVEFVECDVL